jgi:hypothetical protein
LSIAIAEAKGVALRLVLRSAEALSDAAMACGSSQVKTPGSRSRALLVWVTCCDQPRYFAGRARAFEDVATGSLPPPAIHSPLPA